MTQLPENLNTEARMRHELLQLLIGRNAHMTFVDATADFPMEHINSKPANVPYTFWHLVEHLRIAQLDILEFIRDPDYQSPEWPAGYWPEAQAEATAEEWQSSLAAFAEDQAQLAALVQDRDVDLLVELPHAPGYTLIREILVVADHNAYHVGELAILRQGMGLWRDESSGVL